VSYYVINKYVGNKPVFDPANDSDLKVIGAVANAYYTFRPTDPRTQYLVDLLLEGQRRRQPAKEVVVEEIPIIEIDLQDDKGKQQKLTEVAKQGKVVILNFTMYAADFSPQYNAVLADIYGKYSAKGLEVFQVSIDPEEFVWRQAAANLPWITVLDPASIQSRVLQSYNVFSVPTTFILNREGDIVERVVDVTELEKAVAKYI
jgi:peroxiredoxin